MMYALSPYYLEKILVCIYSGVEYREYSPEKGQRKYGKSQTENPRECPDNPF